MATYTLFGQSGGGSLASDTSDYTMGVEFTVSSAATLEAVWFYSASGAGALPETIALYEVTGQALVHSEPATWSGAAGSGWVRAPFTSPPSLTAGTNYKACIFENTGNFFYSDTPHYWDTGPGAAGVTSGPLNAPDSAGADGGQDTFTQGTSLAYPSSSFNATNYWVDPEVSVSGGTVSGGAALAGAGAVSAAAAQQAATSLTGTGSIAASEEGQDASSTVTGSGSLTVPDVTASAGEALTGSAQLAQSSSTVSGTTLSAAGTLTAPSSAGSAATLAGAGMLNQLGTGDASSTSPAGEGTVTAGGTAGVTMVLTGTGHLAGTPTGQGSRGGLLLAGFP